MAISRTPPTSYSPEPAPVKVVQPAPPPPSAPVPPPPVLSVLGKPVVILPQVNVLPKTTTHAVDPDVDVARSYGANMWNLVNYTREMASNRWAIKDDAQRLDFLIAKGLVRGKNAGAGKLAFAMKTGADVQVWDWKQLDAAAKT